MKRTLLFFVGLVAALSVAAPALAWEDVFEANSINQREMENLRHLEELQRNAERIDAEGEAWRRNFELQQRLDAVERRQQALEERVQRGLGR